MFKYGLAMLLSATALLLSCGKGPGLFFRVGVGG